MRIDSVVKFVSGSPQFRIQEVYNEKAPLYTYYGQSDMEEDLVCINSNSSNSKQVRTFDKVNTLWEGDVVFSLISGRTSIVSANHHGYLYTQNYVKLIPNGKIDSKYLVYLLNEDKSLKKQFLMGLQGSQVLKYTLKQLKDLELPELPTTKKQQIIGDIYFNQLRLEALRHKVANSEKVIVLEKLREVNNK